MVTSHAPGADGRVSRGGLGTFDPYVWRARRAPAVVAAVPALAVLGASAFTPEATLRYLGFTLGSIGLVVCGLVRDAGRGLQSSLWARWGGSPTIRRLRWRNAVDSEAVRRLHDRLSWLVDEPLP